MTEELPTQVNGVRLIPLGGLGEIGMNCLVVETEHDLFLVDCGVLFSDLDVLGVDFEIPDFSYVLERKDKFRGFVLTHGHEDHIGAVPFALMAGLRGPVYGSSFTLALLEPRLLERGVIGATELREFKLRDRFRLGGCTIRTLPVNHSIIESSALVIETPVGKIVHTGDFKIDPAPYYGSMIEAEAFQAVGEEGVLLLLSDSTNVERTDSSLSESILMPEFERILSNAKGMTLVSLFGSNIGRMGQFVELTRKQGKKIAFVGRTMERNSAVAMELGYLEGAREAMISIDEIEKYRRDQVVVVSTGCQGEFGSALSRVSFGEHKWIALQRGDQVVLSSKNIPGNEKEISHLINRLFQCGAEVLYDPLHQIHVSGHATRPELKQMMEWVKPKFFLPVHGEYRHLVLHGRLAPEAGIAEANVLVAKNGEVMEVSRDRFVKIGALDEAKVQLDGREGHVVSRLMIKHRRQLAETGVVFVVIARNITSKRSIGEPSVQFRGIVVEDQEPWFIDEATRLVRKLVAEHDKRLALGHFEQDLQETVRVEVRKFLFKNLQKKPVVIPILIDV